MTLKARLAAMMIVLLVAVMGLQYLLIQREQSDLARRLAVITREIDESTRLLSERTLAMASSVECADSVEAILQWIEQGEFPDSLDRDFVFVREDDSTRVEIRKVIGIDARHETFRHEDFVVRAFADTSDAAPTSLREQFGDSADVRIVMPAGHRMRFQEGAVGDGERFEVLKVNIPLPGSAQGGGGRSIQLHYSMEKLTEELGAARRQSWLWLAGLLGVGATGAVLVAVQFTRPIRSLQTSFGRVVEGDLTVRVDPKRPDEIGKLTSSFNEMVSRLRETRVMEKRLSEAERLAAVGRLAAGVAHEVRNPLNAMLLTMQQLADKTAPPEGTEERLQFDRYASMVTGELARLERLVGTFLDLSRSADMARETLDVGESLEAAVRLFEPEAAQLGVDLGCEIEGSTEIEGDPERLPTVWNNLVSNALQATGSGGSIAVKARGSAEEVEVEVIDDGEGIARDALAHVWEPFYSGRPEGTGLGLSLVRSIVEAHGGRVAAESEPGKGTRMRIWLPRRRAREGESRG